MLAGKDHDPTQCEATDQNQYGDGAAWDDAIAMLDPLSDQWCDESQSHYQRPKRRRVRPSEEDGNGRSGSDATTCKADQPEREQAQFSNNQPHIDPAQQNALLIAKAIQEKKGRPRGETGHEEQWAEDRRIPQWARGHRPQENTCVEAEGSAGQHVD
jgi:hypothetical protein